MSTIKSEEAYITQVNCAVFLCKFLEYAREDSFQEWKLSEHLSTQVCRPLDKCLVVMYS